ncbi:methyl-accepting chemotaxis protein [Candidatus Halocynthiibacter alkanivorans]|uniref:methyl-accepting chemotaxis protein n=1 Tax=Candidatus Halocynthiibacter alkanivorans TaxID=2267619 RepID=UPI001F397A0C|nr:HAMP domain-containing methyl-accepting chemotaxis protein [Candidatus Halocynthiibacter alkanivorans]
MKAFLQILGGVTGKFLIVLIAMAGMTGAAVFVGNMVFNSIAAEMKPLTQKQLPNLERAATVASLTGELRDALADILLLSTPELLAEKKEKVAAVVAATQVQMADLDAENRSQMLPMLAATETALNQLMDARAVEFSAQDTIAKAGEALKLQGADGARQLQQLTNTAREELIQAGRDTIQKVDDTLSRLIDEDFKALELALTVRSEISFLSGTALALAETQDQKLVKELKEISLASTSRLIELVPQFSEISQFSDASGPVNEALTVYKTAFSNASAIPVSLRDKIIKSREISNSALETAINGTIERLTKRVAETSSANALAINLLLEWQLVELIELNTMDAALKSFIISGLQGSVAPDVKQARSMQDELSMQLFGLQLMASGKGAALEALTEGLISIVDEKTGIVAARIEFLNTRNAVTASSAEAATQVRAISAGAAAHGSQALANISEVAGLLDQRVEDATSYMQAISAASVILFLIAPVLTYHMIVRPLRRATAATERLASGDMTDLTGLKRQGGEIGSLVRALNVFRSNLVDKERMEAEQAEAELQQRKDEEQARRDEIGRKEAQAAREAERREETRQRELAEAEERDAIRRAADEERKLLMDQQDLVVDSLAAGLQKLANGDLRATIDQTFADRYEQLRSDFNIAVQTLSELIRSISSSAVTIDRSSGEISHAALDLSRRTEESAAALGETAATLTELTSSVQSAADGALRADQLVSVTRDSAEQSSEVVREAVEAMGEIESSSNQISKIISVIDDIAFQTNLLALNAGVEAARAGDAGRGFAVVASEVRALAQRSSDAAREISTLISNSSSQVQRGVGLVDRAGTALQSIVTEVEEISVHVAEIAASAKEQSTGITEINHAIHQLDSVTQQNAAMFEETTAASQVLAAEATTLSGTVGAFSTDAHAATPPVETWAEAS